MRLRVAIPEEHVEPHVLNAGLETLTRLDQQLIEKGEVPTFHAALKKHGFRWKPEPPGDERFDHAKLVIGRGWGDCDDLAPWRAASMRATGEDPGATAVVKRSGPNRWHAIVKRSDGSYEDPSRDAGMGKGVSGAAPAVCAPMLPGLHGVGGDEGIRPTVAARPAGRFWEARADVPWVDTDYALSALARAPVASQAIVGAVLGACLAAEAADCADPEHVAALTGLAALLDGHDPEDVAEVVGEEATERAMSVVGVLQESVGFNFGGLFKSVAPFLSKAVSFIPGVGPVASTALDIATKFIPDGKGGHKQVPLDHPTKGVPAASAVPMSHPMAQAHMAAAAPPAAMPPVGLPTHGTPPTVSTLPKAPFFMSVPGGPLVLRF
jgi:hypothetical protein